MRKNVLLVALVALALPVAALAAQPVRIRVDGQFVPVHQVTQVVHTAAGPVRVRTWSWRGPDGTATFQVSESRNASPAMAARVVAQMRTLQAQLRQIQAMWRQPLLMSSLPVRVAFGRPLLLPLPGQAPIEVRFLRPIIPMGLAPMPARILLLLPAHPHARPPTPKWRGGQRV